MGLVLVSKRYSLYLSALHRSISIITLVAILYFSHKVWKLESASLADSTFFAKNQSTKPRHLWSSHRLDTRWRRADSSTPALLAFSRSNWKSSAHQLSWSQGVSNERYGKAAVNSEIEWFMQECSPSLATPQNYWTPKMEEVIPKTISE